MNKRVISIFIGAVILVGAGALFLLNDRNDQMAATQTAPTESSSNSTVPPDTAKPETPTSTSPAVTSEPGKYVEYKEGIIASTKGTKLLFFHAPWCPQCRDLEASIKASGVPENVSIIKVDYDSNQALRQKYGVTIQTTVVKVDDQGNLIKKFVAYKQPTLAAVRQELL